MPPTRRKSSHTTSTRSQQTLSFSSRSNKVTKPSVPAPSKSLEKTKNAEKLAKASTSPSPAPEVVVEVQSDQKPTEAELAIREQAEPQVKKVEKSEVEKKAEKIGNAQLKRYWDAKEKERKAPRVHQKGLSMNEKILREFDLSSQYGPCVGIARTKRWKRADGLGLKPPLEVLAVLMKEDAAQNAKSQKAYMDELLSSRFNDD